MLTRIHEILVAGSVTALCLSLPATGQTWNEGPDAGQNGVGAAQITIGSGQLRFINGIIANPADVDIFCIRITDEASFSARVTSFGSTSSLNSRLWLFNPDGTLQVWNDNSTFPPVTPSDFFSHITSQGVFSNGVYLLAMSHVLANPTDASGGQLNQTNGLWPGPDYQQLRPGGASVLAGWSGSPLEGAGGNYTITLTGAEFHAIPTPSAAATLGLGGLIAARRRRS